MRLILLIAITASLMACEALKELAKPTEPETGNGDPAATGEADTGNREVIILFGLFLALLAAVEDRTMGWPEIMSGALYALLGALLVEIIRDLLTQWRKGRH